MRKGHGAIGALVLTLTLTTATAWAGSAGPTSNVPEGDAAPTTTAARSTSGTSPTDDSGTTAGTHAPSTTAPAASSTSSAPAPGPGPTVTGPTVTAAQTECLPNYPTVCVPLGPDLDCADLDATDFPVNGSDPFRLDDDANGVACESPTSAPHSTPGPAAAPPSTAAPAPPPAVAGATQSPGGSPSSAGLAATGAATERSAVAVLLLLTGLSLVAAAGVVGDPARGRRGGFTVVSVDRNGTTYVNHVTSSGR
jgi:hypothetical protein